MSELRFDDIEEIKAIEEKPLEDAPPLSHELLSKSKKTRDEFRDMFFDMFLESMDIDVGFEEAKQIFIDSLISKGVEVNADNFIAILDLMKDRLLRVSALKRMTMAMGLQSEYENLMQLELSYLESKIPRASVHPVAQGERTNVGESE